MKCTFVASTLLKAISAVAPIIPSRTPKDILRNVRIDLDGDTASVSSTDLEKFFRVQIPAHNVEELGSITVPASTLLNILKETDSAEVGFEQTDSGVKISTRNASFDLPTQNAAEFPTLPETPEQASFSLDAEVLRGLINQTSWACANENSRYALRSVLFEMPDDGVVNCVATDGRSLVKAHAEVCCEGSDRTHFKVGPDSLGIVSRNFVGESPVEVFADQHNVWFKQDGQVLCVRQVEGRFPSYSAVIPDSNTYTRRATFVAGAMAGIFRQARITCTEESKGVDCHFEDGQLTVSTRNDRGASEITSKVTFDGEPLSVTVDPSYLINAFRVLKEDAEVNVDFIDGNRGFVLSSGDWLCVVMPLTRESKAKKPEAVAAA